MATKRKKKLKKPQVMKKALACIGIDPNTKAKEVGVSLIWKEGIQFQSEIATGYIEGKQLFSKARMVFPEDQILVLIEGQYLHKEAGWLTQQKILKLARYAGRWIQIAIDQGIPESNIQEAYPSAWMKGILGNMGKGYTKVRMNRLLIQVIEEHFPQLKGKKLTEHEYHSTGIALYGLTLNGGYIIT